MLTQLYHTRIFLAKQNNLKPHWTNSWTS